MPVHPGFFYSGRSISSSCARTHRGRERIAISLPVYSTAFRYAFSQWAQITPNNYKFRVRLVGKEGCSSISSVLELCIFVLADRTEKCDNGRRERKFGLVEVVKGIRVELLMVQKIN